MTVKQVIVVRGDLNMRKGKTAAQACHASMKVFFDRMREDEDGGYVIGPDESWDWTLVREWIEGSFTKIVLRCHDENELLDLAAKAGALKLPHAVIVDNGLTEFHGVKTTTALAIGPADPEEIDKVTGHLRPL